MQQTLLAVFAAALVAAPTLAPGSRPVRPQDSLLDRASAVWARSKSTRATFEQTMTNPLTGNAMTARGEFFHQPNRFAVRFTDPSGDRIVNDGKSIWVYVPSSAPGQVIKVPAHSPGVAATDPTVLLAQGVRSRFDVADLGASTVGGTATQSYQLTPKSPDVAFTKAKVWVSTSDATLKQFEVTDNSGLVRRVTITKLSMNAPVKSSEFSFKPPKGVRVFDQAAIMGGR